jgi:hypothetical protein
MGSFLLTGSESTYVGKQELDLVTIAARITDRTKGIGRIE